MHDHTARGGLGPKGREALIPTSATGIVAQGVFRFDDTYSVRVLGTPDEPEFVAADVSGPLGYRMASDMTRRLDDDEKGTRSVRTPSGDQQMTVLTEAGLYAAILGSKSPTAKPFKRWVTHTVLPAIRKTGSYGAQQPALPGRRELAQMVIDAEDRAEAETQRRAIAETKLAAEQLGIDRRRAHALWLQGERDIRPTAVAAYLEHRGIDLAALPRLPGAIRALASHRHRESETAWPAMVAVMSAPGIPFAAVHRTWLARDGRGKAPVTPNKKIWPSFTGAAIRLARGETGLPAEDAVKRGMVDRLLICEGIEDGLSVALAAPELRVWAAGTLGNLAHVKIPDCCHEVIVAADNDWGKPQAEALLKRGIEALAAQRRPVRVARAAIGKDFNDQLRGAA